MMSRPVPGRSKPRSCSRRAGAQRLSSSPVSAAMTQPRSDREETLRPGPLSVTVSITDLRLEGRDRLAGVRRGRSLLLAPRAGLVASWLGAAEASAHDPEQVCDA